MRKLIVATGLLVLGSAAPALARTPAEFFNEFDWAPSAPTPGPTNFEIVLAGNVTCQIPRQDQFNGSTNPFQNPNPITTTFDAGANTTTVSFSGSALKPGQRYHFGLNQGYAPTPPLQIVGKMWSYANTPPSPLPIVNITPPAPMSPKGPFKYAVVYLEASFEQGGRTYGSWYEIPYTPSKKPASTVAAQPALTYSNFGTQPLLISNAGIQIGLPVPTAHACRTHPNCRANKALLNDLDFAKMPPPGQRGSKFVPLTNPPPGMLTASAAAVQKTACAVATSDK